MILALKLVVLALKSQELIVMGLLRQADNSSV